MTSQLDNEYLCASKIMPQNEEEKKLHEEQSETNNQVKPDTNDI